MNIHDFLWMFGCYCGAQVLGAIAGKKASSEFYAPCRTNKYPREIPARPWYRHAIPQVRAYVYPNLNPGAFHTLPLLPLL